MLSVLSERPYVEKRLVLASKLFKLTHEVSAITFCVGLCHPANANGASSGTPGLHPINANSALLVTPACGSEERDLFSSYPGFRESRESQAANIKHRLLRVRSG